MIKLLKYLKPYTGLVIAVVVLMFIQAMTELYLPAIMSDIIDIGVASGDTNFIFKMGGIMLIIAGVGTICAIVGCYLSSKVGMSFSRDLRHKVFTKVENFSLNEFDQKGTSSLITRTTNDITQVQNVLITILKMLLRAPLMVIGGIIMAVAQDIKLSLAIIIVLVVFLTFIVFIAKKSVKLYDTMQKKLDKLNLVLRERLTGIRVIRAFNTMKFEKTRFNKANLDLTDTAIKVNKLMAILLPLLIFIMNLTIIIVFWIGAIRINEGALLVGDLMAFIQYTMGIMYALTSIIMMFALIPRASASAKRVKEVIDMQPNIMDPEQPIRLINKKGQVEFKDVSFIYQGAEKPALRHISFSAKPGEVTAIIGGTGSGKSTLVNLIPRFYDVVSGSVLIDGIDVRQMRQEDIRESIGLVPQKAVLFSGTVAENIVFGYKKATKEEMMHAAEIAQASEFISSMKKGYNAIISQGGTNISGGQKQRLSIARALIRKPSIYIFDDSFSALDFRTDAKLRQALQKEILDSTVIIVAQRVTSVMGADRIIVLDNGEMAGIGTHKELLSSCEVYREIVSSQLSEEGIA